MLKFNNVETMHKLLRIHENTNLHDTCLTQIIIVSDLDPQGLVIVNFHVFFSILALLQVHKNDFY